MKKVFFLILIAAFSACSKPGYKVTVALDGAEGKVLLEKREAGKFVGHDSADFINGVATLTGAVEIPDMYYLSVGGQRAKMILFVENSKIQVSGKADSIYLAKVTGSKVHNEFQGVSDQLKQISEEYMGLYRQSNDAKAAGDTVKQKELLQQAETVYNSMEKIQEDFVKNNPASFVTPYFLARIQYNKSAGELIQLLDNLDPALASNQMVIDLRERAEMLKRVEVGQIAPDFTQNDPDGNPVKLSDVYAQNEYTLVDFWAAWCGPCRQENPNVVAVFNAYKDKGFGVLGVSLDQDRSRWLEAIANDKLAWIQVSDLQFWNNAAAKLYAINSIPANLLVNRKGEIIAKGLRGEDLKKKIAELLDK